MALKYVVILDANFLLAPAQLGIDIFSELDRQVPGPFEVLLPDVSTGELEAKIKRLGDKHPGQQGTLSRQLALARQIAIARGAQGIHLERTAGTPVDDLLLQLATHLLGEGRLPILATCDGRLRSKARTAGIPTAWLRAKRVVEVSLR